MQEGIVNSIKVFNVMGIAIILISTALIGANFTGAASQSAEASVNEALGTEVIYTSPFTAHKVLKIPTGKTVAEMVDIYSRQSIVEYAGPNYARRAIWIHNND